MTRYVLTPLAVGIVLKLKLAKFLLWAAACKLAVLGASAVLTGTAVPVAGAAYAAYLSLF